jgi:hypothetical protein
MESGTSCKEFHSGGQEALMKVGLSSCGKQNWRPSMQEALIMHHQSLARWQTEFTLAGCQPSFGLNECEPITINPTESSIPI